MHARTAAAAVLTAVALLAAPATAHASTYPAQAGQIRASHHQQSPSSPNMTAVRHRATIANRNWSCRHGFVVACYGYTRHTRDYSRILTLLGR